MNMKKLLALAILALAPAFAAAQPALDDLAQAAGVDLKPMTLQLSQLRESLAQRPTISLQRHDVFASCGVVDAKTFRAYSLDEAAAVLSGCLSGVYAKDSGRRYAVEVASGRFPVSACPAAQPGAMSCMALREVDGLIITVRGTILTGDGVLADLDWSIQKRGGRLLGYPAKVDSQVTILK